MENGQNTQQIIEKMTLKEKKLLFLKTYRNVYAARVKACRLCSITIQTLKDWMSKDPELVEGMELAREEHTEWVESKLIEKVRDGNWLAIRYWLENRAPDKWRAVAEEASGGPKDIKIELVKKLLTSADIPSNGSKA